MHFLIIFCHDAVSSLYLAKFASLYLTKLFLIDIHPIQSPLTNNFVPISTSTRDCLDVAYITTTLEYEDDEYEFKF